MKRIGVAQGLCERELRSCAWHVDCNAPAHGAQSALATELAGPQRRCLAGTEATSNEVENASRGGLRTDPSTPPGRTGLQPARGGKEAIVVTCRRSSSARPHATLRR